MLTNNCLTDLAETNKQIYRLLDNVFNGTQYAQVEGAITPPIPAVPLANSTAANAARAQLRRLHQLAENAATGAEYDENSALEGTTGLDYAGSWRARLEALQGTQGGWFGLGEVPVTLADLLRAGRVNDSADQGLIANGIEEIAGVVASGGSITTALTNLLGAGVDAATDGGLAAVQIAAIVANAASSGALAGQLARLTAAIDGGGLVGPGSPTNNLLYYGRAASYNNAGELAAGQLLEDIYNKLDVISNKIRGEADGTLSISQHFNRLQLQLSGLVSLSDLDTPVVGVALQQIQATLACICEGVSGTPEQPAWPADPVQPCGAFYPTLTLRGEGSWRRVDDFAGGYIYQLELSSWQIVSSSAGVTWAYAPDGALIVNGTDSNPYQVCVSHLWPSDAVDPPAISGQLNAYLVNGGDGNRGSINYNGSPTTATLYRTSGATGQTIGYALSISAPDGPMPPNVRFYIHAGALG